MKFMGLIGEYQMNSIKNDFMINTINIGLSTYDDNKRKFSKNKSLDLGQYNYLIKAK